MKKVFAILYICILLSLSGCGKSGTVLTAYRDTASLKVVQTIGIDPGLRLTVTSGGSGDEDNAILLSAEAQSMGQCMERLQDYATDSELFYSHLQYILLSEDVADIAPMLDYIERSVDIRMRTNLFLVRGSAGDIMTEAGSGDYDMTRVLSSLMADVNARGRTRVFSCAETARSIAHCGGGLICALRSVPRENSVFSGEDADGMTAVPDGFGILRGSTIVGSIPEEMASALCALTGAQNAGFVTLDCGGSSSTVQLCGCKTEFEPVYENGKVTRVEITLDFSALLTETQDPESAKEKGYIEELGNALGQRMEDDARVILDLYRKYDCDFLALGPRLRAKGATEFDRSNWYSHPGDTLFSVCARGEVLRTYESGG